MDTNNTETNITEQTTEGIITQEQAPETSLEQLLSTEEFTEEPQPVQKPEKKRRRVGKGMVAVLLVCVLLAGGIGSGITAFVISGIPYSSIDNSGTVSRVSEQANATTAATHTGEILSVAEISAKVGPSVVSIAADVTVSDRFGRSSTGTGTGSGIIITKDGYILTNNHVIEGADTLTVTLDQGKEYEATVIGADSQTDLAVIKIDATDLPVAVLGDSDGIQVGDAAIAIGNPLGELTGTVTTGIISATNREITIDSEKMNLIQTDAAVNPGNSGGALCNAYGEIIGVVNAKTSALGVEGLGFAIPINDVKSVIDVLIKDGHVSGRAALGVAVQEVTEDSGMMFSMDAGLYVSSLTKSGAAANAGIEVGDRIVSVDGTEINTTADLKEIIENHSPSDNLKITLDRNGEEITVTVTLTEAQTDAA
jgi:serine protease Do